MFSKELLSEIKADLHATFGIRLKNVVLFGSVVRGDDTPESDVDALVILDQVQTYSQDLRQSLTAVYPISTRLGRRISVKPVSWERYRSADIPLLNTIRREGVTI